MYRKYFLVLGNCIWSEAPKWEFGRVGKKKNALYKFIKWNLNYMVRMKNVKNQRSLSTLCTKWQSIKIDHSVEFGEYHLYIIEKQTLQKLSSVIQSLKMRCQSMELCVHGFLVGPQTPIRGEGEIFLNTKFSSFFVSPDESLFTCARSKLRVGGSGRYF